MDPAPAVAAHPALHPTLLDWMLRPLSKVRRGEGLQALLLLACIFMILTSYYLMKTAREGLILSGGTFGLKGEELKSYSGGAMAALLILVVPAYGALVNRAPRMRLINVSYAIVIACLLVFYALARLDAPIGLAFFVWIGIVNMFLIAQFWSYANDLYTEEQGKRLFAIIAIGGSLGAVLGPELAKLASTLTLLPLAAILLVGCLVLFNAVERLRHRTAPNDRAGSEPIDGHGSLATLFRDRYLLLIAALVLVGELVKTNGEYILSSVATEHAAAVIPASAHADLTGAARTLAIAADRREVIKAFYSSFFLWANVASLVIQAFLVSRLVDKLGVRKALFVMPLIALGAYGMIGVVGSIALVRAAKMTENATEYSVQNTVRQILFLPTDRSVKYKAKAAIDTFVVRAADSTSALLVWIGVHELGTSGRDFAYVNVVLVGVWIIVAIALARSYCQASSRAPQR
jgi:ATP:ADP antiporter, AAA family